MTTTVPATALGMVETRGLVASIEAADAMSKVAYVKVICQEEIGGGYVTIRPHGEVLRPAHIPIAIAQSAEGEERLVTGIKDLYAGVHHLGYQDLSVGVDRQSRRIVETARLAARAAEVAAIRSFISRENVDSVSGDVGYVEQACSDSEGHGPVDRAIGRPKSSC